MKKNSLLLAIAIIALGLAVLAMWQAWRFQATTSRIAESGRVAHGSLAPAKSATINRSAEFHSTVRGDDFAQALALLRGRLDKATPDEIMDLLQVIAKDQPAMAIDLAESLGRTEAEKSSWVSDLAKQWTQRAPQAAWDWLAQLSNTRVQALAEGAVPNVIFNAMAASDPVLLLRNIDATLREDERSSGVPRAVAVHLGLESLVENNGIDAARRAVEGWAGDPMKPAIGESAYITVANALRETDPQDAALWLLAQPASEDRNVALSEFSAHWAQKDPVAALSWAEALPTAELQISAVQRTFNDWVERDAAPATRWLGDYLSRSPANADTDRLIEAMINLNGSLKSAPKDALQWTGLISDAGKRAAYEEKIALNWGRQDLQAATNYVWASPGIPADRKQVVIQQIKQQAGGEFND